MADRACQAFLVAQASSLCRTQALYMYVGVFNCNDPDLS